MYVCDNLHAKIRGRQMFFVFLNLRQLYGNISI